MHWIGRLGDPETMTFMKSPGDIARRKTKMGRGEKRSRVYDRIKR